MTDFTIDYPVLSVEIDLTGFDAEHAAAEAIRTVNLLPHPDATVAFRWDNDVQVTVRRDSNFDMILLAMNLAKFDVIDKVVGPHPQLAAQTA